MPAVNAAKTPMKSGIPMAVTRSPFPQKRNIAEQKSRKRNAGSRNFSRSVRRPFAAASGVLHTVGGRPPRWPSKTNGCSILRSTRQTRRNGRDRCASGRSQSGSRKTSGLSTDRSWFGRTSAACGSLRIHGRSVLPMPADRSFEPPGGGRRDQLTKKERTAMTQEHSEGQARRAAKRVGLMARKSPGARARSIFSANS